MNALIFSDWKTKIKYSADGPQPQVLVENDKVKIVLGGLVAGQQIPNHPEAFGLYHILEGTGWMTVDDERFEVTSGATIITPAGARRGFEAITPLAFLAARIA